MLREPLKDATGDYRAGLVLLLALAAGLTAVIWHLCRQLRRGPAMAVALSA